MERPLKDDTDSYEARLEEYCDVLEETISALRDDYSEQVKVTAELRRYVVVSAHTLTRGN